ncbi:MAG: hypothetical protein GTO41_08470 [Burkholderiales bacterium]|nr:hypothetical protein [Burkholderiales bacterium]
MRKIELLNEFICPAACLLAMLRHQRRWEQNVLFDVERIEEIEGLEDKTDFAGADVGK